MKKLILVLIPVVIVVLGFALMFGDVEKIPVGTICAVMFGAFVLSQILSGGKGDEPK